MINPKSEFSKKGFAPILIIVIVALAAAFGGWYLVRSHESGVKSQEAPTGEIAPQVTTTTRQVDTSTWKTYANTKYGFQFTYPANFDLRKGYNDKDLETADHISIRDNDVVASGSLSNPPYFNLGFYGKLKKDQTAKDLILPDYNYSKNIKHLPLSAWQGVVMNGINFNEFTSSQGYLLSNGSGGVGGVFGSGFSRFVYVNDGTNAFEIMFPDQPKFNQILSTFKFIN